MSLGETVLSSGRRLRLFELRMSSTYGGMLEGRPNARVNEGIIRRLRERTERAFSSTPVHLVPPARAYPDLSSRVGPVELLPDVACVGLFDSAPLAPAMDGSGLVVVWFQPTTRVPAGEDADPGLRGIAWEELARDYEY
ncbi:hypothetical protein AB0M64_09820 [Streptomyces sp. NPDC051771]|uniref:hypothetical protein n=1 Tax=Streptomyces sp. NPDC051771 TaxID=3154847 RepID=UPI003430F567